MDDDRSGDSTRRQFIATGLGAAATGALAGCTGSGGSERPETATREPTDAGAAADATEATDERETATSGESYTVSMAPMGEVTFESVPERWMAYFSTYGDMGIALGQLDGLQGLVFTENWPLAFYDHLPGVDVSFDGVTQLMGESGLDKEAFYELGCDVHLFDPNHLARLADGMDVADFEEVAANVGPVVGNSIRRRGGDWHDYRYYSLYEAFENVAQVFQERERYEALKAVHDDLLSTIRADLPPADERPTVGLLSVNSDFENGTFYAYPVHDGNGHKQYRDLGMRGAFDDHIDGSYAEWDYETILEIDPDALVFQYGFSHVSTAAFERRMDAMREDPLGQQLSAVESDRLYRGGTSYQGPIVNLFQTEVAAKQFYPETFGAWDGLDTLADADARLFDYQRVADAINGAL